MYSTTCYVTQEHSQVTHCFLLRTQRFASLYTVLCVYKIKCKKIINYFTKWHNIPGNDLLFSGTKCPTLSYEKQTGDSNPVGVSAKLLTISIFLITYYLRISRPCIRLDHDIFCHTPIHTAVSVLNSHAVASTNKTKCKIYKRTIVLKDIVCIISEYFYIKKIIFIEYIMY